MFSLYHALIFTQTIEQLIATKVLTVLQKRQSGVQIFLWSDDRTHQNVRMTINCMRSNKSFVMVTVVVWCDISFNHLE